LGSFGGKSGVQNGVLLAGNLKCDHVVHVALLWALLGAVPGSSRPEMMVTTSAMTMTTTLGCSGCSSGPVGDVYNAYDGNDVRDDDNDLLTAVTLP